MNILPTSRRLHGVTVTRYASSTGTESKAEIHMIQNPPSVLGGLNPHLHHIHDLLRQPPRNAKIPDQWNDPNRPDVR